MSWSGRQLAGNWDVLWHYTWLHLQYTVISLLLGTAAAFVLGFVAYRIPRLYPLILAACNALYAIPSVALFVLLGAVLFSGRVLTNQALVIAMAIYTLAILVRNMVEGLRGVSPAVRDAATAMGFRPTRRFLTVELPLAMPAILAGLRVAAVSTISLITVGGVIGRGALGQMFQDSFNRDITIELWAALIAVVVLAIIVDALIVLGGRLLTPWTRVRVAR
jgi:osmoprotectant transport system permease protein